MKQAFSGARSLSIHTGSSKYLDCQGSGGSNCGKSEKVMPYFIPDTAPDAPGLLYELKKDPLKSRNLYFEKSEIVKELKTAVDESKRSGGSAPFAD